MSKKNKNKKHGEFIFFVPDQGEGAAKGVVIALKVLMLIITTICCLVFGIFGPIVVWTSGITDGADANPAILTWLISSCIYIVGTFVIMLGHSKIASVIDIIAMAGMLVTYYLFVTNVADPDLSVGPTQLYMPSISLTVLAIVISLLINIPKWLEKQAVKERQKAPSILLDDDDDK